MRRYCVVFMNGLLVTLLGACLHSDDVTGSENVYKCEDAVIELTDLSAESNDLTAGGTVQYGGDSTSYPPWYLEGDFYADSSLVFKLGGIKYAITFTLDPGETTAWEMEFSEDVYTESNYPDFAVKNLQACREMSLHN